MSVTAPTFAGAPWTADEDGLIVEGILAGYTYALIIDALPGRTIAGVQKRVSKLREDGSLPSVAPQVMRPEMTGSIALLRALLRHGARREGPKGLPGLPYERFRSLCHQHGVAIL